MTAKVSAHCYDIESQQSRSNILIICCIACKMSSSYIFISMEGIPREMYVFGTMIAYDVYITVKHVRT